MKEAGSKEFWGSHWGFMLATAGSAIGLGNIWKFPYITGMNGGGAFVLIYLLCVMMVGLPVMICELSLGRATGCGPVGAFNRITPNKTIFVEMLGAFGLVVAFALGLFGVYGYAVIIALSSLTLLFCGWKTLGILCGVIVPVIIMSYYGVIGGWTLIYIVKAFSGGLAFTDPNGAKEVMEPILQAPRSAWGVILGAQIAFMFAAGGILLCGVKKGIERWSKILMPLLFILLLALLLRSVSLPNAIRGVRFFLSPDFSKLSTEGVLLAMGHAFFTLSLAMGITITFGSYLRKEESIVKSSFIVIALDTTAALMAGLAIFPAVFAMGFEPGRGPSLTFEILPAAFNLIPGELSTLWNGLFFLMLFIAALTSSISLMEPVISFGMEECRLSRKVSVVLTVILITLLGVLSALSVASWEHFPWIRDCLLGSFGSAGGSMFDMLDSVSSNWLLPIGGLGITIYVGWIWGTRHALKEIRKGMSSQIDTNLFLLLAGLKGEQGYGDVKHIFTPASLWGIFVRWITPVLLFLTFLYSIGVIRLPASSAVPEVRRQQLQQKAADSDSELIHPEARHMEPFHSERQEEPPLPARNISGS